MESALALITVGIGFAAMIITIIIGLVILVKQGNRHDSEIAALRAELLTEMRTLGDRIANRVALDERVRAVEQRLAASGD